MSGLTMSVVDAAGDAGAAGAGAAGAAVGGGESERSSARLQKQASAPLAVFCSLTLDHSGSMDNMYLTAPGGVHEIITEQLKSAMENGQIGRMFVSVFDDEHDVVIDNMDFSELDVSLDDVKGWMKPRGCTRLYDSAIQDIDNLLAAIEKYKASLAPEVLQLAPEIVSVWVCCTDGFDNMSAASVSEFAEKVKAARKAGVKCTFIAANQDAVLTGQKFGFDKDSSLTFGADNICAPEAFRCVSHNLRQATSSGNNVKFSQAQRISSLGGAADDVDSDDDCDNTMVLPVSPLRPPTLRRAPMVNLRQPAQPYYDGDDY
jgi:hypothetical protein